MNLETTVDPHTKTQRHEEETVAGKSWFTQWVRHSLGRSFVPLCLCVRYSVPTAVFRMKHLLLALALSTSLYAADKPPTREELAKLGGFEPMPDDPADSNIFIEMQVVSLPETDALSLIEKLNDPAQIEKAYATIQDLLRSKKAKLIAWPTIITQPGQRAVFEQVDEVRYAGEFSKPLLPKVEEEKVPADEKSAPEEILDTKRAATQPKVEVKENDEIATPSAFETRNAGVALEIEPSLDTQTMLIDMKIMQEHDQLTGYDKHIAETQPGNHRVTVEQPRFVTHKTTTNLTLKSGSRILLAQYRDATQADWMELFILKATAKKVR